MNVTFDTDWLVTAFVVSSGLRALFFVPQVLAVLRSGDGARDIVLSTWSMWTVNNLLGALYAAIVVHHLALAVSFAFSALACVLILAFAVRARQRMNRRATATATATRPAAGAWLSTPAR